MTRLPVPGPAARPHGPYETQREAADAARRLAGPPRSGWSILSDEQNRELLTAACQAAGVSAGAYDELILGWLSAFEDSTCAVVAGLISRAHQASGLTHEQIRIVLDSLDVAAHYKRERAANCPYCDADPADLCGTCSHRLAVADDYDALAETLRSQL